MYDQSSFLDTNSSDWRVTGIPSTTASSNFQGRLYVDPTTGSQKYREDTGNVSLVRPRPAKTTGTERWAAASFVNGNPLSGSQGDRPYPATTTGGIPQPRLDTELYDPSPMYSFGYNLISALAPGPGAVAFKNASNGIAAPHFVNLGISAANCMKLPNGAASARATSFNPNNTVPTVENVDLVTAYDVFHDMYLKPMSALMDSSESTSTNQGYLAGIVTFLGSFDCAESFNTPAARALDSDRTDGSSYPARLGANLKDLTDAIETALGVTNTPIIHVNPLANTGKTGEPGVSSTTNIEYRDEGIKSISAVCDGDPYRTQLTVYGADEGERAEQGSDGIHLTADGMANFGVRLSNHYWKTFVDKGLSIDPIQLVSSYRTN